MERPTDPRRQRRDRLIREAEHDPYHTRRKPKEPACCGTCGAVFRAGRWQWLAAPFEAQRITCPACERVRDSYPAGILELSGSFLDDHRDEVLALVHRVALQRSKEHPLQRIMAEREEDKSVVIETTDLHLVRAIGEAISHAYQGELDYRYTKDSSLLRVTWHR
jgi:NMD protein affecting ribosome stability and mRNA decay